MTSGRTPGWLGYSYRSTQTATDRRRPVQRDGANSAQRICVSGSSQRRHRWSTLVQYSPSASTIPSGQRGVGGAAGTTAGADRGVTTATAEPLPDKRSGPRATPCALNDAEATTTRAITLPSLREGVNSMRAPFAKAARYGPPSGAPSNGFAGCHHLRDPSYLHPTTPTLYPQGFDGGLALSASTPLGVDGRLRRNLRSAAGNACRREHRGDEADDDDDCEWFRGGF